MNNGWMRRWREKRRKLVGRQRGGSETRKVDGAKDQLGAGCMTVRWVGEQKDLWWPAGQALTPCPHRPISSTVHAVTEILGGGSYPW